ncbi:AIG2-like family protein [Methyloligella halotolerans]|uniref:AIG2-like family protein n=1 Tax=Methyloligella halotolerans TaxID=1177755 RepID=A0A1E2RYI4_9HYPH|nr:gamma-glutamylcyclotransferase family protein [Methyloligella halotolerans]ODA67284.1 AIG2-like family protein [Methyloligella halotolerans]
MPEGMPRHLFVYGTLRRGSQGPMAAQLHAATTWIGPATASGALYDFGSFPGAVFDPRHPGFIVGEVFVMPEDARLLAALDAYEGIAEIEEDGLYRRVEIELRLRDGEHVSAWSYELVEVPPPSRRIPHGDWLKKFSGVD